MLPPSKEVKSIDEIVFSSELLVTIAYFGEDDYKFEIFTEIAKEYEGFAFVHSFDPKLNTSDSNIVIYKNFDEKISFY